MEKKLKKTYKDSNKSSLVCSLALSAILLGSCASYPVNPPLQQLNEETGYRLTTRTLGPKNSDELFVVNVFCLCENFASGVIKDSEIRTRHKSSIVVNLAVGS